MATFEDVKRAAKELALLQHKDDSDEMLRETVKRNGAQLLSNTGLTDADMTLKSRLSGEIDGCMEILSAREKANEDRVKKNREWHSKLPERKAKAILNLPNAASPNGQLVAAILEETPDGLTEKQLASWCDELSAIPEDEFKALLDGLVDEEIISRGKRGRYQLLTVLENDMLPSITMLRKKLEGEEEGVKIVWAFLNTQSDPISIHEINQMLGVQDNSIKDMSTEFASFTQLCIMGLATEAYRLRTGPSATNYRTYYAPRLLGEVDDE